MWCLTFVNCKENREECENEIKGHSALLFVQKDRHLTVYLNFECAM